MALGLVAAAAGYLAPPANAATLTEVTGFGSNPGVLQMFEYIPTGLASNRPVVVALHGCTMSASTYDDESGWTKWADQMQFALVMPQQTAANQSNKCFNWWLPGDQSRDQGEALSIKQMVDYSLSHHGSDGNRVYVTGLSAGAAMTNVMAAVYPDVFKGAAPVAGVPYKCAVNALQTGSCNRGKTLKTPVQWGDLVRGATTWTGPWPKVSIWHGTSDGTVNYANLTEEMEQWTNVNGVDQTADVSDTVGGYPHKVYKDGSGNARVETYSITSMGHGQPIDPGTGAQQCGVAVSYSLDVNLCASYYIALWFGVNV